jgi:flagellar basal-body rod protein FlgF
LKELWVPVSGAIAQQKQIEVIANNIANVNTNGFKKDDLSFKEHLTALEKNIDDINIPDKEWAPEDFYDHSGAENSFVKINGSYTNHTQGQMVNTNGPLDMAIKGDGFFEVLTPNGVRYTRGGSFGLSADGTLVTDNGHPVLSEKLDNTTDNPNSRIIKIPTDRKFVVNLQGEIVDNTEQVAGKLSIIEFNDKSALIKDGQLMYVNRQNENIKNYADGKSLVYQGFLESSNVNPIEEMTKMIKANRSLESIQRVIKTYDNMAGRSTNEILKF